MTAQPTGRGARLMGGFTLGALAAITAVISYQHGLEVVRATGTRGFVAYLVPVVADLMIFASSLALLDAAQRGQPRPPLAVVSLAFGICSTVAMNVASGWHHGYGGALVSALAPVALVLSYETLMGMVRRGHQIVEDRPAEATGEQPLACPHGVAEGVEDAALVAFLHARDCLGAEPSRRQVADAFGINRNRLGALVRDHDEPPADEVEPVTEHGTKSGTEMQDEAAAT
ncbi:DUF2637 domain-containing protein [Actinomadura sp. 9N215]|uniref:DUF2637 domain-containing protein n=1 Tax=Actinomadura sp. 9N215 TaxID=3375150 RepID=UPI0037AD5491